MYIVYGKAIDYVIRLINFIWWVQTIQDLINWNIKYIIIYIIFFVIYELIKNNQSRKYLLKEFGIFIVYILTKIAKVYGLLNR